MITSRGLWKPCSLGYPDRENCPDCTPPVEDRCEAYREGASDERRIPCRVLGPHERHNDGMGTIWFTERICSAPCPYGGSAVATAYPDMVWWGHCNRRVREPGLRCWQHRDTVSK